MKKNKGFIRQVRIKKLSEKYKEMYPDLSQEEIMRMIVNDICGAEGVKKFDELSKTPKECKKIMKGQDFSKIKEITESEEFNKLTEDIPEDDSIEEELIFDEEEDVEEEEDDENKEAEDSEKIKKSQPSKQERTKKKKKKNNKKKKNKRKH